jgi:hypothetical protein
MAVVAGAMVEAGTEAVGIWAAVMAVDLVTAVGTVLVEATAEAM